MRRRALCAASMPSGGDWALELHLTPEWEYNPFGFSYHAEIFADFSEPYNKLQNMCLALGTEYGDTFLTLSNIPDDCNFTIDGERLTSILVWHGNYIEVTFGDYCGGVMTENEITLEK